MLMNLQETNQITEDTKILTNKLKNMHLHLTELLNKKLRLEVEIRSLQKSITNKQKEFERTLKVKLVAEASEETLPTDFQAELRAKEPQPYTALQEFDKITGVIQQLNESLEITSIQG